VFQQIVVMSSLPRALEFTNPADLAKGFLAVRETSQNEDFGCFPGILLDFPDL